VDEKDEDDAFPSLLCTSYGIYGSPYISFSFKTKRSYINNHERPKNYEFFITQDYTKGWKDKKKPPSTGEEPAWYQDHI